MLTDRPPAKPALPQQSRRSDQLDTLDLPLDDRLTAPARMIEAAMAGEERKAVRLACMEFLQKASELYNVRTPPVRCHPVWQQLYPTSSWAVTDRVVHRAEAAGCPVLVITVDLPAGRNTETQARFKAKDSRKCAACHQVPFFSGRKPMFDGADTTGISLFSPAFTWDSVRCIRASTRMRVVLKGIVTTEDAKLALDHGIDAIIVSNHGGRAEESGRATIESLPEVIEAVRGTMPVLFDGGVRRGTDVFKALALGSCAVGIGRPLGARCFRSGWSGACARPSSRRAVTRHETSAARDRSTKLNPLTCSVRERTALLDQLQSPMNPGDRTLFFNAGDRI